MSVLRSGDEDLHYSDNSHRWVAPDGWKQADWESMMRTHLDHHLATMGGPPESEDRPVRRRPKGRNGR